MLFGHVIVSISKLLSSESVGGTSAVFGKSSLKSFRLLLSNQKTVRALTSTPKIVTPPWCSGDTSCCLATSGWKSYAQSGHWGGILPSTGTNLVPRVSRLPAFGGGGRETLGTRLNVGWTGTRSLAENVLFSGRNDCHVTSSWAPLKRVMWLKH